MNMDYPLVRKAYLVAHKDEINLAHLPETPAEIIYVKPEQWARNAISKYYQSNSDYPFIELRARRCKGEDIYLFEGREYHTSVIHTIVSTRKWREDIKRLTDENKGAKVYIYSGQWGAYWRPNACGYTTHKEVAGVYDIEDAYRHVAHCGIEKKISFELLNKEQE